MIIEGPEHALKKYVTKRVIVKANDRMIHKNRTKAIETIAKRISERIQNNGVIEVPNNNINETDLFFNSDTSQKIKTKLTWENFKNFLQEMYNKEG